MKLLELLSLKMKEPVAFKSISESWFHYLALLIVVFMIIWSVRYFKSKDQEGIKKYLLIFAIILIAFEVYKQVIFTYQNDWTYRWYAFPYQFCSIPMYVSLLAALTKRQKIFDMALAFLATYGLFAGTAVMMYPQDVFIETIGINIQTMVHHGGISVVGFSLILAKKVPYNIKTVLKASVMFSVVVLVAIILNFIHNTWIAQGTFNMFFINPKYDNHIPVLSLIQPLVGDITFIFVYYFGFTLVALIVFMTVISSIMFIERQAILIKKTQTKQA
ncbi:hypothetical protein BK010_05870 [Tenericutes bacterium MO-XQ]|nr:hypothetical protein BK010_05870 [Tenericutes bacterium MO-XQ]